MTQKISLISLIIGTACAFSLSTQAAGTCERTAASWTGPLLSNLYASVTPNLLKAPGAKTSQKVSAESLPAEAAKTLQDFLSKENHPALKTEAQEIHQVQYNGLPQGWLVRVKAEKATREYAVQYGLLAISAEGSLLARNSTQWMRPEQSLNFIAEQAGLRSLAELTDLPSGLTVKDIGEPSAVLPKEVTELFVSHPRLEVNSSAQEISNAQGVLGYQVIFQLRQTSGRVQEKTVSVIVDKDYQQVRAAESNWQ